MKSTTERFSDRVEDYVKYRPSYPAEVIEALQTHCGLGVASVVADVGAGTGIFTDALLSSGCRVFAVEPNDNMRHAAEERLGRNANFHSVSGTAENTTLGSATIDIVTVAQAFHWFRRDETRREFRRILKPGGWTALVWNERKADSPFHRAYEELLRTYAIDYSQLSHRNIGDEALFDFLGPRESRVFQFPSQQQLDWVGLQGRARSTSYIPTPDQPGYQPLMAGLESLFAQYAKEGQVAFEYQTKLYVGKLHPAAP